jgi:hypothetical protein
LVVLPLHVVVAREPVSLTGTVHAAGLAALTPRAHVTVAYGDVPDLPAAAVAPQPLPSVVDVMTACRGAGCHGTPTFTCAVSLPVCDSPELCALADRVDDLGELSLHVVGAVGLASEVEPDALVDAIGLRKPAGTASLRMVCGLTAVAGPLFVCDDVGGPVAVVWPHDRPGDLASTWPW